MPTSTMDLCGLKCPQPAMKVASQLIQCRPGDILEAVADCETFEADIRKLCQRWDKVVLSVRQLGGKKKIQIQI